MANWFIRPDCIRLKAVARIAWGRNAVLRVAAGLLATVSTAQAGALVAQSGGFNCRLAAQVVEREAGLPMGLLSAIGRVETGRTDPATGRVEPWSWSTNMATISHYFSTEAEAIDWTAVQLASGQRSIDVGCFQINLMYHPEAFDTLEQAFDPLQNARYAAQFLISLYRKTGSWQQAAEQYHSADPARGVPYGNRVMAFLEGTDAPIIPASYVPRAQKTWTQAGPAVFGIQIFVPSSAKDSIHATPPSIVASRTPSGGVLVMMPVAANRPVEDPRNPPAATATRTSGTRTPPVRLGERNLPHVYTPSLVSNDYQRP